MFIFDLVWVIIHVQKTKHIPYTFWKYTGPSWLRPSWPRAELTQRPTWLQAELTRYQLNFCIRKLGRIVTNFIYLRTRVCIIDCNVIHVCRGLVQLKKSILTNRSKKRIKGQNFCQTIEDLSFHRSGYLSNDRYMLFEMLQYQINCTIRKNRILVHVENSSY